MKTRISIDRIKMAEFCRRNHIRRLAFFGSVLREDFRPTSDVDVLVEFEPGHTPGFIRLYQIEEELSPLVKGHRPDLVTPGFLNRRIRNRVLTEAEVQYAEG
ncbi:MAG: nucleotidyltransferase domain-containing protein [Candidatus Omnitrophica bacterium]|nr:nucleotidyltransferase domain-containing protein [Candidatus Omnitrophota bacterium]